jgi:hypothetical protein
MIRNILLLFDLNFFLSLIFFSSPNPIIIEFGLSFIQKKKRLSFLGRASKDFAVFMTHKQIYKIFSRPSQKINKKFNFLLTKLLMCSKHIFLSNLIKERVAPFKIKKPRFLARLVNYVFLSLLTRHASLLPK